MPMPSARLMLIAVAAALAVPCAAWAQNIQDGQRIAQVWCANCHVADATRQKSGSDAAPTFAAIAAKRATTEASLAAFLGRPHARMPDLHLSTDDIGNVISPSALRGLQPQDFEWVDGGTRVDINQQTCTRMSITQ